MKKRTTMLLVISFAVIIITTLICMFSYVTVMGSKSTETITSVGKLYMSGLNERMAMHFETTIDSRMNRLDYITESVPPNKSDSYTEMNKMLSYAADARGLSYLAYMTQDGKFIKIYGDDTQIVNPDPFFESMEAHEKKITVATDEEGDNVLIMGVSAEYTLQDGSKSLALVAGVPMDYIKQLLALDSEDTIVYSHIIRHDGSFVMKSREADGDNYLDMLTNFKIEGQDGRNTANVCDQLKTAMEKGEDFSEVFLMPDGEREHIYCTSLPYCEWYLVTIMPYGELDTSISGLNSDRTKFMVVCVCIIVAELLCVFIAYLKMSRKQIRETEAAREEAVRASKAKSDFLSNMSHDIRTPMNAIVGMTAIAASNIDNTAKVEDCLKKITLSSRHLLGLINDVLDMSTIENGKMTLNPELVSLRDVMDSIVKIVQPQIKTKHQSFDVFIKDIKFENVYCDSVRLNQVLLNFLSNAIKFTPDGGSISVTISQEDSPKSHDCVRTHIYVKDTGIGMTPDFIKIIFESFEREDNKRVKKTEGTGLGMAITKHIVDAMGGTIEVESEPDVGTQFHVTLDLEAAMIEEEEMILPEWHMLLVDDDKELCESAYAELNSIGLKTEYTYDGETAVEMVWDRHNKHDDYHIVLLDWQLPGIDGIETARRIRKKVGKDVPILLISAYDWSDFEEEAREAGVSGFISKPLFRSTLFYGLKPYAMPDSADLTDTVSEKKSFEGIRILVAEDNDLNWEIAEGLLEQIGIMTEHAEDGQACVDMFRRSPINYYDAILMDIRMPVKNGYEATNEIRFLHRSDSELPIIAMTADAFSEDIKKCLDGGMNAHIAKPISIAEVEKQLSRFL